MRRKRRPVPRPATPGSTGRRHVALAGAFVVGIGVAVMSLVIVREGPAARSRLRAHVQPESQDETVAENGSNANVGGFAVPAFEGRATAATATDPPRPKSRATDYDHRSFDQMGDSWRKEADNPEWSLNAKTFIGAMIETMNDTADATGPADAQELGGLSVRCRQTVCRLDGESPEILILAKLLGESQQEQYHVAYQLSAGEAGEQVEAYLGREREGATGVP